jgi:hypothetical protein
LRVSLNWPYIVITCLCTLLPGLARLAEARHHHIARTLNLIDGAGGFKVYPGDTLELEPGTRGFMLLRNLHGQDDAPIVICSRSGQVRLSTAHYYGMSFRNCTHIKLTGSGLPDTLYGIQLVNVDYGAGISVDELSSDFEIEYIEIGNTLHSGIVAKTDPACDRQAARGQFVLRNLLIHNNYLHDIGEEGIYVGSTFYLGTTIECNGVTVKVLPHTLENVKVYQNRVERTGWDGIQVSSVVRNCAIFENQIRLDSRSQTYNQMSGIMIGSGCVADCYNNLIIDGLGSGIECYGSGGQRIFNNIIINAGAEYFRDDPTKRKYGIYVADRATLPDSSFHLLHNTIINPKTDGIRFASTISRGNKIINNIIIHPGAYDYYALSLAPDRPEDAYIMLSEPLVDAQMASNYCTLDAGDLLFMDADKEDFRLTRTSPAVDAGQTSDIVFDYRNKPRPMQNLPDLGALEYDPTESDAGWMTGNSEYSNEQDSEKNGIDYILLLNAQPNPFSQLTGLQFRLKHEAIVDLAVFNEIGQQVRHLLFHQFYPKGRQVVSWDGCGDHGQTLPNGIYFCRIKADGRTQTQKIVKTK